jgi:hypothetical protein
MTSGLEHFAIVQPIDANIFQIMLDIVSITRILESIYIVIDTIT